MKKTPTTPRSGRQKIENTPTLGERIKALRLLRGENQQQFGESLHVNQSTVSAWERNDEDRRPSAEMLFRIGSLCKQPEGTIWFWGEAGLAPEAMLSAVTIIMKDRIRQPETGELIYVPPLHEDTAPEHKTGIWLPAQLFNNPNLAVSIVIDEQSATDVFRTGDVIVMEVNLTDSQGYEPFLDQMVVVQLKALSFWKGKMILNDGPGAITVLHAKFGPTDESRLRWQWNLLPIGAGSGAAGVVGYVCSFEDLYGLDKVERLKNAEFRKSAEKEIEAFARNQGFLRHARILGRFIAWFRPPAKSGEPK